MQTEWFRKCTTPEEKKEVEKFITSNRLFRDKLSEIINRKVGEPLKADYDNPSWPYKRADLDGYNRALTDILKLLGD